MGTDTYHTLKVGGAGSVPRCHACAIEGRPIGFRRFAWWWLFWERGGCTRPSNLAINNMTSTTLPHPRNRTRTRARHRTRPGADRGALRPGRRQRRR